MCVWTLILPGTCAHACFALPHMTNTCRWNVRVGIPDRAFVLVTDSLETIVQVPMALCPMLVAHFEHLLLTACMLCASRICAIVESVSPCWPTLPVTVARAHPPTHTPSVAFFPFPSLISLHEYECMCAEGVNATLLIHGGQANPCRDGSNHVRLLHVSQQFQSPGKLVARIPPPSSLPLAATLPLLLSQR